MKKNKFTYHVFDDYYDLSHPYLTVQYLSLPLSSDDVSALHAEKVAGYFRSLQETDINNTCIYPQFVELLKFLKKYLPLVFGENKNFLLRDGRYMAYNYSYLHNVHRYMTYESIIMTYNKRLDVPYTLFCETSGKIKRKDYPLKDYFYYPEGTEKMPLTSEYKHMLSQLTNSIVSVAAFTKEEKNIKYVNSATLLSFIIYYLFRIDSLALNYIGDIHISIKSFKNLIYLVWQPVNHNEYNIQLYRGAHKQGEIIRPLQYPKGKRIGGYVFFINQLYENRSELFRKNKTAPGLEGFYV